jgi:hypothetical protein
MTVVHGGGDVGNDKNDASAGFDANGHRAEPHELGEIRDLLKRAHLGDASVLPRLRELLDTHHEVWRHVGDMAAHVEEDCVRVLCGQDVGMAEMLRRKLAEDKVLLGGPSPSPVERLLVGRVVVTGLQLSSADAAVAAAALNPTTTIVQGRFAQDCLDRAARRFERAIAALASVQRLLPAAREATFVTTGASGPLNARTAQEAAAMATGNASGPGAETVSSIVPATDHEGAVTFGVFEPGAVSNAVKRGARARRGKRGRSAS